MIKHCEKISKTMHGTFEKIMKIAIGLIRFDFNFRMRINITLDTY